MNRPTSEDSSDIYDWRMAIIHI